MSENADPELIEVMARGIHFEDVAWNDYPWGELRDNLRDAYARQAKATLQALQSAGYVIEKPFWPPETPELSSSRNAG